MIRKSRYLYLNQRFLSHNPQSNTKEKLDAEIIEEERLERQKQEEANITLIESWENIQAMMEADRLLDERLQTREREELTDEEKGKLFMELMEKRRKHFAELRAQEKRNRPPTRAHKRTQIYDEIQKLFDKEMKRVNTFVAMSSEAQESNEKKEEGSEEKAKGSRKKMLGRKRARKEQQQESLKKQRMEEDKETDEVEEVKEVEEDDEAELKKHLVIKHDDDIAIDAIPLATKPPVIVDYKLLKEGIMVHYQLIRADGSSKRYSSMIRMLQGIDREDLLTLWKLVKTKHGNIRPKDDHERVMWGDFKVMFQPDIRSKVWRDLQGYTVSVWKLYDSCGVHFARNRSRIGINIGLSRIAGTSRLNSHDESSGKEKPSGDFVDPDRIHESQTIVVPKINLTKPTRPDQRGSTRVDSLLITPDETLTLEANPRGNPKLISYTSGASKHPSNALAQNLNLKVHPITCADDPIPYPPIITKSTTSKKMKHVRRIVTNTKIFNPIAKRFKALQEKVEKQQRKMYKFIANKVPAAVKELVYAQVNTQVKNHASTLVHRFLMMLLILFKHVFIKLSRMFFVPSKSLSLHHLLCDINTDLYIALSKSIEQDKQVVPKDSRKKANLMKRTHDDQDPPENHEGEKDTRSQDLLEKWIRAVWKFDYNMNQMTIAMSNDMDWELDHGLGVDSKEPLSLIGPELSQSKERSLLIIVALRFEYKIYVAKRQTVTKASPWLGIDIKEWTRKVTT
ncbi:hypothetical protein Tco_0388715 [Tanacetum coccineum]